MKCVKRTQIRLWVLGDYGLGNRLFFLDAVWLGVYLFSIQEALGSIILVLYKTAK